MWDSFLIFTAIHPFASCLGPIIIGCFFLFKKISSFRVIGSVALLTSILLSGVLHFRWDSFSVHFWEIQDQRASHNNKILFVGDSITCEGSRPRGFITKIQALLPLDVRTLCHKGATTAEIIDLVDLYKVDFNPAMIFAQSGINDLLKGKTHKQISESQQYLYIKLSNKFPNSKVVFLPIHPIKTETSLIATISAHSPTNFQPWWEDKGNFVRDFLLDDGVHLSAKGHSLLAKAITNNIISKKS